MFCDQLLLLQDTPIKIIPIQMPHSKVLPDDLSVYNFLCEESRDIDHADSNSLLSEIKFDAGTSDIRLKINSCKMSNIITSRTQDLSIKSQELDNNNMRTSDYTSLRSITNCEDLIKESSSSSSIASILLMMGHM